MTKPILLVCCLILVGKVFAQQYTNSITQYGITWTFDKSYEYGQFVNGDYWVLGPVIIIDITPRSVVSGNRTLNGSMLNPAMGDQGFDNWMLGSEDEGWEDSLNVGRPNGADISAANPLNIKSGSLISSISYPDLRENKNVRVMAVLTILTTAPPANSFRPPYIGTNKSLRHTFSDVNMGLLPNLALPPQNPSYSIETATVLSRIEKPWVELMGCWANEKFCAPENMPNYGRDIANIIGNVACQLLLDIDQTDKQLLMTRLIQIGLDNYGIVTEDAFGHKAWEADGGHMCGRAFPILFAGYMLDDEEMFGVMKKSGVFAYQNGYYAGNLPPDYIHFGEQDQTFYVTRQAVDITHDLNTIPWNPDARSTAIPYETSDIGKPGWGIRHAKYPGEDNNNPQAIYLEVNLPAWAGYILSSHILGIKDAWNNPALFDYEDYFLTTPPTTGYFFDNFVEAMWNEYRDTVVASIDDHANLPSDISGRTVLFQNYPNPVNDLTTIEFRLESSCFASLKVYDIFGKELAVLLNDNKVAGNYKIEFNASQLHSGIYLYTLQAGNFKSVKKLIVL